MPPQCKLQDTDTLIDWALGWSPFIHPTKIYCTKKSSCKQAILPSSMCWLPVWLGLAAHTVWYVYVAISPISETCSYWKTILSEFSFEMVHENLLNLHKSAKITSLDLGMSIEIWNFENSLFSSKLLQAGIFCAKTRLTINYVLILFCVFHFFATDMHGSDLPSGRVSYIPILSKK